MCSMATRKVQIALLGALVFSGACSLWANEHSVFDMTLEELLGLKVTVASRHGEVVREAPAVLTVVTRAEIEGMGARNLLDVINRLPGMQVLGHAGFYGNRVQLRAQPNGAMDRRTLILLNGRPVRETVNGGNNAYLYLGFPVSAIESIEIVRGPGSVLYGSNAFGAIINIKTRTTAPNAPVGAASATYGTYDTRDFDGLIVSRTDAGLDFMAAVRTSRSQGPQIAWTDNAGTTDSLYYSDDTDSLYVRAANDLYSVQAGYHRYVPGEFGTLGTLTDAIYISEVEAIFADLGLAHHFGDSYSANLNLTLNTFNWEGSNDGESFFQRRYSENLILEPMLKCSRIEDMMIVVGGTVEYDQFDGRELIDHGQYIYSLYGHADYRVYDWLKAVLGLQYNKTPDVDGNYSPRVGLVLTPGDHWGMKLLYNEAFRRAYAVEGFIDSAFLVGNTSLEPELIETYEAQLNYQNEFAQVDLTLFRTCQNVIEVDGSARPLRWINHPGDLTTEGVEVAGRCSLGKRWQALGSAMTHSTDNSIADQLAEPNYPDYMIKGGVMGKFDAFSVALFNSYFSEGSWRHEAFNNLQANVSVDLSRAIPSIADGITLSLYADNILDETPSSLPSDVGEDEPLPHYYGRRIYVTVEGRW